jgi:integrase
MDSPVIGVQHQPIFDSDTVSKIFQKAYGQERVLYALLAVAGIRVGETLGLEVQHLSDDCRTITVEQSSRDGEIQEPKTKNAYQQVDLSSELANLLGSFARDRQSGLLS